MIPSKSNSAAIRTLGNRYPDFPELPASLRTNRDQTEWHAKQTEFWNEFRLCLDRVGVGDRGDAPLDYFGGGANGRSRLNTGQSGRGGGTGGNITPNTPGVGVPGKSPGGAVIRRLDGGKVFYQTEPPGADQDPQEGDLWFDTDDAYRVYEFRKGKWVDIFKEVPSLEGKYTDSILTRSAAIIGAANARAAQLIDLSAAAVKEAITVVDTSWLSEANEFKVVNAAIDGAFARITREEFARATADEATAGIITTLQVEVGNNAAAIITEQNARISADGSISANLSTEVTARQNGDNGLSASITTEQTARVNADNSLSAEYVVSVATGGTSNRRITGFRITNLGGATNQTEFVIQTDKFTLVDTSGNSPRVPFVVTGGNVYIDRAVIREVEAGAIIAGEIQVGLSFGISHGGSLTVGSGSNRLYADTNGTVFGNAGGVNIKIASDGSVTSLMLRNSTSIVASFTLVSGQATLDMGSGNSRIQSVNMISTQKVQILSADDLRDGDAPLFCQGSGRIMKTFETFGLNYFNDDVELNGALKKAQLQFHPSSGDKCNFVCGADAGSDHTFATYLSFFANGSQVWVPFLSAAP